MKRIFLILSILWSCISVNAQLSGTLNQKDENGNKQGHWIYYGADRPEAMIPPEGKVEEGNYTNDRKEGVWIKYHEDGVTPKLIGQYEKNRPKGNYEKYYPNGQLKEFGLFEKNLYHDTLYRYHENGALYYIAFYDSIGKEDGLVQYFFPNGQLEFTFNCSSGKIQDSTIRYYNNGDIHEIEYYNDSSLVIDKKFFEPVNPLISPSDYPQPITSYKTFAAYQRKWIPGKHNHILFKFGIVQVRESNHKNRLLESRLMWYSKNGDLIYVVYKIRGNFYTSRILIE